MKIQKKHSSSLMDGKEILNIWDNGTFFSLPFVMSSTIVTTFTVDKCYAKIKEMDTMLKEFTFE